jgi:hypothetical protein
MTRRLKGLVLASVLLLASVSAFALPIGQCQQGCFCYYATDRGGDCGTISSSGCYVLQCIQF